MPDRGRSLRRQKGVRGAGMLARDRARGRATPASWRSVPAVRELRRPLQRRSTRGSGCEAGGANEVSMRAPRRCLRALAALLAASLGVLVASCGSQTRVSNAAPPTVICGALLSSSAAGALVYDITTPGFRHGRPVTAPTIGGVVIVRVAPGCLVGSTVRLRPTGAFRIVRRVRAKDGGVVVVELKPLKAVPVVLTAERDGRVVGTLRLDISKADL